MPCSHLRINYVLSYTYKNTNVRKMAVQIKSRQSVKKKIAFAHPHNQPGAWAVWLSLFLWHKWRTGFKPGPSVSELIKHRGTYSPTPLFLGEINGSFLNLRPPKNWWVPSRILQTCWRYVEKSGWQVISLLFILLGDRSLALPHKALGLFSSQNVRGKTALTWT